MSRVRTYGIDQKTLEAVADHVYDYMLQKSSDQAKDNPQAQSFLGFLTEYHDQSKLVILTSVVFAVGNFDRIKKVECEAELDESGKMVEPEPVDIKYVA